MSFETINMAGPHLRITTANLLCEKPWMVVFYCCCPDFLTISIAQSPAKTRFDPFQSNPKHEHPIFTFTLLRRLHCRPNKAGTSQSPPELLPRVLFDPVYLKLLCWR